MPNQYILDIQGQGEALREALKHFDETPLDALARQSRSGVFDRVIVTGMGASYYGGYPAALSLSRGELPVLWIDTAELLHYAADQLTPRTLLWIISQSGRSAESVALIALARRAGIGAVLGVTNDPDSPLAQAATVALPLHAEPEQTVSTRTYLHTLAFTQLAAAVLFGGSRSRVMDELSSAADGISAYLMEWENQMERVIERVGLPASLALLGRGPSLAAAFGGALVLGEAARFPALAMSAAEFRHGPLEMAGPDLGVLVYAGAEKTAVLNRRILNDLLSTGARALWLAAEKPGDLPESNWLPIPQATGAGLPLAEALPAQLLSVHLAQARGITPGRFKWIDKVTLQE